MSTKRRKSGLLARVWNVAKLVILGLFVLHVVYVVALRWVDPPLTLTQLGAVLDGQGLERDYVDLDTPPDGILEGITTNVESGTLYGGELQADLGIPAPSLQGRLAFTFTMSVVRATADVPQPDGTVVREFISRASRIFGTTGLKYEGVGPWWVAANVRWSGEYEDNVLDGY